MDRVRLGRVLGRGARMAARTVYEAVDAATTPQPPGETNRRPQPVPERNVPGSAASRTSTQSATPRSAGTTRPSQRAAHTVRRVQSSAGAARRGVLDPVKRASRAVTLEITGSFFALFAMSFAAAAWRFRSEVPHVQRLWACLGFAALFAYFAVSSFLRARRLTHR